MLSARVSPVLLGALALASVACGGNPPPPPAPPTPPVPAKVEAPEPPPPAPEPSAAASAAPGKPQSSGRAPVLFSNPTEITESFGSSPAAKVEIGTDKDRAVFRVPENALHTGHNITFKLDTRARGTTGQVGKIFHMTPYSPPDPKPVRIENTDIPFQFELPTGGKKDVSLAIGVIDDKGKVAWQVLAPKRVDDGAGIAYFDVPFLVDAYVHLTTQKPAAPAPAK